ncbi:uncharacterized protein LOC132624402 [Lycium barbarum]|uniref:uncharacterized protein LOC132624402 n=1 Tax=Lycium barbarum TaxID=112863 RepID=UPI00293ECF35|nr:uncharacterized protein LOC132624402 [Lycium barbarum]
MPSRKGVEELAGEEEENEEEEEDEEEKSEEEFDEELEGDPTVERLQLSRVIETEQEAREREHLEEARTSARAAGIPEEEIDTYVAMQQSYEASRKSRGASQPPRAGEDSSSAPPPADTPFPPSVGPEIVTPESEATIKGDTELTPLIVPPLEVLPTDQTPSDA